jgi:hypothetical protein
MKTEILVFIITCAVNKQISPSHEGTGNHSELQWDEKSRKE